MSSAKLFQWIEGKKGEGYLKLLLVLAKFPVPWDLHFLKMPEGSSIEPHVDPYPSHKMYRINFVLQEPEEGGQFVCPEAMIDWRRIKFFRPDIMEHSVQRVDEGERFVLSFGFCIPI